MTSKKNSRYIYMVIKKIGSRSKFLFQIQNIDCYKTFKFPYSLYLFNNSSIFCSRTLDLKIPFVFFFWQSQQEILYPEHQGALVVGEQWIPKVVCCHYFFPIHCEFLSRP